MAVQSLRIIKRRIRSIENTFKITRAMQMVSIAKLKRNENALSKFKPYFDKIGLVLNDLLSGLDGTPRGLLKAGASEKTVLCVVSSDTGLCASYNNNVIKAAEDFISRRPPGSVSIVTVGKKAFSYFKRKGLRIEHAFLGLQGRFSANVADEIASKLTNIFTAEKIKEVYIAYTHFRSLSKYAPVTEKFLNIEPEAKGKKDFMTEPSSEELAGRLIPRYLSAKMRMVLLESFMSEHASRMIAMKGATDNAKDLKDNLVLLRNKARQASITKEVIEIISAITEQ